MGLYVKKGNSLVVIANNNTTTTSDIEPFIGASTTAAGKSGAVPAPATIDTYRYLRGDGGWVDLDNESLGTGYVTCDTTEDTLDKSVTLSGYKLINYGILAVKFTYAVKANSTLLVNTTETERKPIYFHGAAVTDGKIKAGDVATFMYNGTAYELIAISGSPTVTFNYAFEVEDDGNLYVVYDDEEEAPTGFSIDSNGYLVYESED